MRIYAATDIGKKRPVNEDCLAAVEKPVGPLDNLMIIADGMGGHKAGDFASRYLVDHFTEAVSASAVSSPIRVMREALEKVNRELFRISLERDECKGMGTTIVAGTTSGGLLYAANVGDSRLYLIRSGRIRQITRDHSYVEEMVEKGQMSRGSDSYRRSKNIITRAVGINRTVECDFFEEELQEGDQILLCSDGLTNMLSDAEILAIAEEPTDLKQRVEKMIHLANEHGGRDNISVILAEPETKEVNRHDA